jgi:predicted kinase
LIHLNGPSGIGKTTLAQRYAVDHPGVLVCDIDVLRQMVAGWQDDFQGAGSRIRTTALAAITAYLATGYDVVVPQLIGRRDELARFRAAADEVGATYVGVVLTAPPEVVVDRFHTRAVLLADDFSRTVGAVVDGLDGDEEIVRSCTALAELADAEGLAMLPSTDLETTYDGLLAHLGRSASRVAGR